jgi:hypothetical protein
MAQRTTLWAPAADVAPTRLPGPAAYPRRSAPLASLDVDVLRALPASCAHSDCAADHPLGCQYDERQVAPIGPVYGSRPPWRDVATSRLGRRARGVFAVPYQLCWRDCQLSPRVLVLLGQASRRGNYWLVLIALELKNAKGGGSKLTTTKLSQRLKNT